MKDPEVWMLLFPESASLLPGRWKGWSDLEAQAATVEVLR
jgi:hypothetical protein